MDTLAQLQTLTPMTLAPLVRHALDRETLTLIDWEVEPFGAGAGQCVYRFMGHASDGGEVVPWSLIVKVAAPPEHDTDPVAARYWKREMLTYQSGLLASLPAGLAAPRYFGVTAQPGGGGWLWLEDIADALPGRWPQEHFVAVARQLGIFGAAYVTTRPLPAEPWLSRKWFRSHIADSGADVAALPTLLDHPDVRPAITAATAARICALWDDRDTLCDALDQLPQTFCHLDINPRNLLRREMGTGAIQSVAIDWEFAGVSALGAELASLIGGSLLFDEADLATADDLDAAVFASYLVGLADVGWRGDAQQIRLGYLIALALHLVFIQLGTLVYATRDATFRAWCESILRRPYSAILDHMRSLLAFNLDRADQARQILRSM